MLFTIYRKKLGADSAPQKGSHMNMLRVRFNAEVQGIKIDDTIEAVAPMSMVYKLRKVICGKVAKKVLGVKIRVVKFYPQLDPDHKEAWTNEQFYALVIDYYNEHLRKADEPKLTIPKDEKGFLDMLVGLGKAEVLAE